MTEHGNPYRGRPCAAVHNAASLVQKGENWRNVLGSPAYLMGKLKGDKSLLGTRWLSEDVYGNASQDPRDKGKTGLFEV